jgi:hypothetical protein
MIDIFGTINQPSLGQHPGVNSGRVTGMRLSLQVYLWINTCKAIIISVDRHLLVSFYARLVV